MCRITRSTCSWPECRSVVELFRPCRAFTIDWIAPIAKTLPNAWEDLLPPRYFSHDDWWPAGKPQPNCQDLALDLHSDSDGSMCRLHEIKRRFQAATDIHAQKVQSAREKSKKWIISREMVMTEKEFDMQVRKDWPMLMEWLAKERKMVEKEISKLNKDGYKEPSLSTSRTLFMGTNPSDKETKDQKPRSGDIFNFGNGGLVKELLHQFE